MRGKKGFTLLELAIVLLILGILIGLGAGVATILIKRAKFAENKEIMEANLSAIKSYISANSTLPTDTSALAYTIDAYGKNIIYVYSANLGNSVCGYSGTNITLNLGCTDHTCTSPSQVVTDVAFLIISGGANHNIQTVNTANPDIVQQTADPYTYRVDAPVTINIYAPFTQNVDDFHDDFYRPDPYDDIVKWVTIHELYNDANCPEGVSIETQSLPPATEDKTYEVFLEATGPNLKWGILNGGTCDITNTTVSGVSGIAWLNLDQNGRLYGFVNEFNGDPGVLQSCTVTLNINDLCVCADMNNNNSCDTGSPDFEAFAEANYTLTVNAQPVKIITSSPLPDAWEGTDYATLNVVIDADGGSGNYTYSLINAPAWLNIDPSTGLLSGTPPADTGCSESVITFAVRVQDNNCGTVDVKSFSMNVKDPDCYTSGGNGGGGGGGGRGCSSYTLRILNSSQITVSYNINGGRCNNLLAGQSVTRAGLAPTDVLDLRQNSWCWDTQLISGDMQSLDINNDCVVDITCECIWWSIWCIGVFCSNQ